MTAPLPVSQLRRIPRRRLAEPDVWDALCASILATENRQEARHALEISHALIRSERFH